jgi:O-antigen ligase
MDDANRALPQVTEISTSLAYASSARAERQTTVAIVASLLFVLLAFATVTVWVRRAWATQMFQIGIFALVTLQVVLGIFRVRNEIATGLIPRLVYLIPIWGVVQIVFHTTTSSFDTREAVLRWGSLAGVFYLTQTISCSKTARRRFLTAFFYFATAIAILFLLQFNSTDGRILGIFPTEYFPIYATFQNKNNYVQFVELALPIALWGAVREGWRSWWFAIAAGILYASAIGAASRAGLILCSAELVVVAILGLIRKGQSRAVLSFRAAGSTLLIIPIVAGAFTFAVGWNRVLERFKEEDPFFIRREYFLGAVEMARNRPLTGFGLDTFQQVYQRYATKDFELYANHAHNDWAEFAADGGIPFLLLVAIPFLAIIPDAFRSPWSLGLVATMLSACVDFPFPRLGVSAWMFAMLAILYLTRRSGPSQTVQNPHSARDERGFL